MADHIHNVGGGSYHPTNLGVGNDSGKKFSVDESHDSAEESGGVNPFVKKMFPSISEANAKKFMQNLFNSLNLEIKKDVARAKETARRIKEDINE